MSKQSTCYIVHHKHLWPTTSVFIRPCVHLTLWNECTYVFAHVLLYQPTYTYMQVQSICTLSYITPLILSIRYTLTLTHRRLTWRCDCYLKGMKLINASCILGGQSFAQINTSWERSSIMYYYCLHVCIHTCIFLLITCTCAAIGLKYVYIHTHILARVHTRTLTVHTVRCWPRARNLAIGQNIQSSEIISL